jgi:hypothetical protein
MLSALIRKKNSAELPPLGTALYIIDLITDAIVS